MDFIYRSHQGLGKPNKIYVCDLLKADKAFNQQVKRNIERFQNDMMFQLSDNEVEYLRSQFVTANISSKSRSNPYVFTEQGVYMLMTVLKGELAVKQSIALVRTFK